MRRLVENTSKFDIKLKTVQIRDLGAVLGKVWNLIDGQRNKFQENYRWLITP